MSLLTIIQDASREVGIPVPEAAYGSTDLQVAQMVRLANKDGKELVKRFDWQVLTKESTFISLAQEAQTSFIPADFSHFVNETFFNRTQSRPFEGPLTSQDWQRHKATVAPVILEAFRLRGNSILIMPTPTAGDTFAFEYISKYWVDSNADGAGEAVAFGADTHTSLIDEECITLGVIWRLKMAKGLGYAEDFRSYETRLARLFGKDVPKKTMDLSRPSVGMRPNAPAAPEGSWAL